MKKFIISIFSLITFLSFATIFSNEQAVASDVDEWHEHYSYKDSKHDRDNADEHTVYVNGVKKDCVRTTVYMRSVTKCKNPRHPNEVSYSEWYPVQVNHSVSHK